MRTLEVRNVHQALPLGVDLLNKYGEKRTSRNGVVYVAPWPVTTVYHCPWERVLFWPQRDANPFFHLLESMWMLAGRNDISPLVKIVKRMQNFSDDGVTQHGAYGYRWRHWFNRDQLKEIIEILDRNKDDRRCVLQMWDAEEDLGRSGKDVPCNTTAAFQINGRGRLDLMVFCRSNDIIWGAYGANAVHFSFLLEYVAAAIGVPMGRYYQISCNWHGYVDTFEPLIEPFSHVTSMQWSEGDCPYASGLVQHLPMLLPVPVSTAADRMKILDAAIEWFMNQFDSNFSRQDESSITGSTRPFCETIRNIMKAHSAFVGLPAPERFHESGRILFSNQLDPSIDWVRAAHEWLLRRFVAWEEKMMKQAKVETTNTDKEQGSVS